MNFCKYFRLFFALLLANFLLFLSFVACFYCYQGKLSQDLNIFQIVLLICLITFSAINFLFFCLLARIIDNKKKNKTLKQDFDNRVNDCFEKISDSYNLVEIGRVSFGVYHDLANILTASNLALHQLSLSADNNKKIKKSIERVMTINIRANNLIKSFKRQCQKSDYRVNFLMATEIKKSLDIFNFYFIKDNISLNLNLDKSIKYLGDPIKFGQVIINLINNAIDSFRCDEIDKIITITLRRLNNFIELKISDSGSGISSDDLKNIFTPFFSLKRDINDHHCGIGLSLVKKIIENDFLGKIYVFSSIGSGTSFIISLPR